MIWIWEVNGVTKKIFNITGPCIPELHYMVDTQPKIKKIVGDYIEKGYYFTINRARQYGKTTTIGLLTRYLQEDYIVLPISFEGFGAEVFSDEKMFVETFMRRCYQRISMQMKKETFAGLFADSKDVLNLAALGDRIVEIAEVAPKPIILVVDEVDKSSNEQLFLDFLGMLREKYNDRLLYHSATFHSVILVGVHDVKNLKLKLRSENQTTLNSPWNIAASFDVDMSFSVSEISTMLEEYENDYQTGMDVMDVSKQIYYYTSGYPFLVSYFCKVIHDNDLSWDVEGVDEAKKKITKTGNTLFDDVIKNIKNNSQFDRLLRRILYVGEKITFQFNNPEIELGIMYGILKENNHLVSVSNMIFKTIITDYYISIDPNREKIALFEEDSHINQRKPHDLHTIAYPEKYTSHLHKEGASAFIGKTDHPDSRYYVFNDFYNMESDETLHLLSHFETYQQTTEYTCGAACTLMVLNWFNKKRYHEHLVGQLIESQPEKGSTVENIADFFDLIGWNVEYHADTDLRFNTIEEFEQSIIQYIDRGIPILVDWVDWSGHWQVIIGIDTCGSEMPYDDVLIFADPYDITDHFQNGYYTFPLSRFFGMWREGPCAGKEDPYKQPFVIAYPREEKVTREEAKEKVKEKVESLSSAIEELQKNKTEENLWNCIVLSQNRQLQTFSGLPYSYYLKIGRNGEYRKELWVDRRENSKSISWSSICLAFQRVLEYWNQPAQPDLDDQLRMPPVIDRPKALGDIRGVSYIYPLFHSFGLLEMPQKSERRKRTRRSNCLEDEKRKRR